MEFALTASGSDALQAQLLQVRPLATARHWPVAQSVRSPVCLPSLEFLQQADALAQVAGDRTVLSLMSDWNPAELIGAHPRPLALSLFQDLIADGLAQHLRRRPRPPRGQQRQRRRARPQPAHRVPAERLTRRGRPSGALTRFSRPIPRIVAGAVFTPSGDACPFAAGCTGRHAEPRREGPQAAPPKMVATVAGEASARIRKALILA